MNFNVGISSNDEMCLTVIDKSQPIELVGSRRTFDSGVRARSNYRRTSSAVSGAI